MKNRERIDRLNAEKQLPHTEWTALFTDWDEDDRAYAAELARAITAESSMSTSKTSNCTKTNWLKSAFWLIRWTT